MKCPKCEGKEYEETCHGTSSCFDCGFETRIKWVEGTHFKRLDPHRHNGDKAELLKTMVHKGPNGLRKTMLKGMRSDLATLAQDIDPESEFTHDAFCKDPYWDCGTPISNWQASREFRQIIIRNGHWKTRAWIRHYGTFLFGGGRVKKQNGWFFSWKNRPVK